LSIGLWSLVFGGLTSHAFGVHLKTEHQKPKAKGQRPKTNRNIISS
jgi:hypothetical protein